MKEISIQIIPTSLGDLMLGSVGDELCLCDWRYRKMRSSIDQRLIRGLDASFIEQDSPVISAARDQLNEYLNAGRKSFDIPIKMVGTPFQQRVWNELLKIPFGKTKTYLEIAHNVSSEKAIRAVAAANGANSISIFVPCHRILGSNGELTGYAGGLDTKRKLLQLEGNKRMIEQLRLFS
jgi:methylated-DNA-[protein]-cysteine S-methyltransferase